MSRPRACRRSRPPEAGTTIVEVVVAALLLAMLAVVATSTAIAAQSAVVANRSRVVASGLAARELDFARQRLMVSAQAAQDLVSEGSVTNGHPLDAAAPGTAGQAYVVDGMRYAVERVATQRVPGSTSACAGGGYVERLVTEVTVTVSWEAMGSARPYVLRQVFAPHRDAIPLVGEALISVRVVDHEGDPVAGVAAAVTSPSGVKSVTTDASGCAVAAVPIGGGAEQVTVALSSADRVAPDGSTEPTAQIDGVVAGELRSASFTYALSGSLVVHVSGVQDDARILATSDPGGILRYEAPDDDSRGLTFTLSDRYPGGWGVAILDGAGTPSFEPVDVAPGGDATITLVAP